MALELSCQASESPPTFGRGGSSLQWLEIRCSPNNCGLHCVSPTLRQDFIRLFGASGCLCQRGLEMPPRKPHVWNVRGAQRAQGTENGARHGSCLHQPSRHLSGPRSGPFSKFQGPLRESNCKLDCPYCPLARSRTVIILLVTKWRIETASSPARHRDSSPGSYSSQVLP